MTANCLQRRWFFATPQIVFDITLLEYLIGLIARGGLSFTAFAVVYIALWSNSVAGTRYAHRTNFLGVLEVVIIVYGAILMFRESGVAFQSLELYLRPHHHANDFRELLALVKEAFAAIVATHDCWLFRRVRGVVLDGKWSIQTRVIYCREHLDGVIVDQEQGEEPIGKVISRRKKVTSSGVYLEYQVDGRWTSEQLPSRWIRSYEEHLLRKQVILLEHECNKDTRKGVDETIAGRKSAGILVGVAPCLQIVAVAPMFSAESIAQVALFLMGIWEIFNDLVYVIYDNACAVKRHLRKRVREDPLLDEAHPAWRWLTVSAIWVIDRLHFGYHKACRDVKSSWSEFFVASALS